MLHRVRHLLVTGCVAVALTAGASAQNTSQLGAGVELETTTPIKALYEAPEKFLGKTIRIDGVVTDVCDDKGCWIALAQKDAPEQVVRFKVEDGVIVFPVSARGKMASAQGVFEKIAAADAHANAAASEHAAKHEKDSLFTKTYHVKATGAVIR